MSSGFETNELLYPVTKGDVRGHDFHGNQYTQGMGGTFHPAGAKKGSLADLKSRLSVGTKLTLLKDMAPAVVRGNLGTTTLGSDRSGQTAEVVRVRSNGIDLRYSTGKESRMDFPKASELTYTPENGTFTVHSKFGSQNDLVYKINQ